MEFGFSLPNSLDGAGLCRFAKTAESLEFESIWASDHIVLSTAATTQYPYSSDGTFSRPGNTPFLELMVLLSYIGACTEKILVGSTVIILPYRNPVLQAKMFASLDVLTNGRVICGVGVGWLEKEFETLSTPYSDRGPLSDECIEIFKCLWTQDDPVFDGAYYSFDGIQFYPKPVQKPHIPIWVGGHTKRAIRRTVRYGNAWHPARQTPEYVGGLLPYLNQLALEMNRDPDDITVSLKRTLHFTDIGICVGDVVGTGGAVIGSTKDVVEDIKRCEDIGINQLTYDFLTDDIDESVAIIDHFANTIVPQI